MEPWERGSGLGLHADAARSPPIPATCRLCNPGRSPGVWQACSRGSARQVRRDNTRLRCTQSDGTYSRRPLQGQRKPQIEGESNFDGPGPRHQIFALWCNNKAQFLRPSGV